MPEDETKVAAATAAVTPAAAETPASPAAEQPAEETAAAAAAAAAPLNDACGGSDTGADADAEAETGGDGDGSDSGSGEYMQYKLDDGDDEEDEEFEEDDFFDEEFEEYEEFEEDEEEEEESSAAIRDAGLEGLITSFAKLQLGRGGVADAGAAEGAGDAPRGDASLAAAPAKLTGTIPVTSVVDLANIKLSLLRNLSLPAEAVPATIVAAARWALVAHGLSADVASADAAMSGIAIVAVDSPADKADPQTYGKNTRLHELLRAKGVELLLNRPKQHPGATSVQGSVDVSIAVEFLRMSHCFRRDAGEAPGVVAGTPQLAILASGDADFQPAIEAALALNPDLVVGVLARREGVSRLYREWIDTHSTRLVLVPLEQLADGMRDLDVRRVPRRDFDSEGAWVAAVLAALEASTASAVSLRASHCGVLDGAALGALSRALARAPAAAAGRLTELWVDHCNRVGPAAVEGLGGIVAAAPNLSQIHISNTGVTAACLVTLANRAQGAPGRQDRKLYVNATFTQVNPEELSGSRFTPGGGGQYVRRNVRIKIGTNYGSRRTARMQPFGAKGGKGGGGGDVGGGGGFGAKGSKGSKGSKGGKGGKGGKSTKGSKGGKKGVKGGEKGVGGGGVAPAAPAQPLGPRGQKRPKKQSPFAKTKKNPETGGKVGSGSGGKAGAGAGKGSGKGSKGGAKGGKQQKKKKK